MRKRSSQPIPPATLRALVVRALREDRADSDQTTLAVLPKPILSEAHVIAESFGIVSGVAVAREVARIGHLAVVRAAADGSPIRPGTVVLALRGDARRVLAVERTLLNFLMHLSGVATAASRAVRRSRGLAVHATRKTLPGLRDLEKAAVVQGGGHPHRRDLASQILIKNNHLVFVPVREAVRRARRRAGKGGSVEVEVRSLNEAVAAVHAGADRLLIDNQRPARSRAILRALTHAGLRHRVWVELSGGITARNVARYRGTGADAVSMGALTHSAPAIPFHLTIRPLGRRSA